MGILTDVDEEIEEVSLLAVPVAPLTDDDIQPSALDTTKPFEYHVDRFKAVLSKGRKKHLLAIWEMGCFVNTLKEQKVYGGSTVQKFVDAMGDSMVDIKTVYKWGQFAEIYKADDIKSLLSQGSPSWFSVSQLMRIKDAVARKRIETALLTGDVLPSDLSELVTKVNNKSKELTEAAAEEPSAEETATAEAPKPEGEYRNSCTANFRKLNSILDNIINLEAACLKDIDDLSAIIDNEKAYDKAVDVMELFLKSKLIEASKTIQKLKSELEKTI